MAASRRPARGAVRPLRYHLRFQIAPGKDVERDARTLAAFCRRHGVEEAVLFYAAEEWNNGLLSRRDEDRWFDTIRRAKPILDAAGIVVSLNPWATTLHGDSGRRFPRNRAFAPLVSPAGEVSRACASFADPAWRTYLCRQYARFAALGFRVIWIEDDFRYHNHKPLTWGGGFEPVMLARFAERVGPPVTRDEVVRNILRPGEPHPWRALWMGVWRKAQLEIAGELAAAVSAASPGATRLGLMTSAPAAHSIEGRDWRRLFETLSIDGHVAHRPNFYGSGDHLGHEETRTILMLDVQRGLRPPGCEVAPELENYPFTCWAKSDSLTFAQMALCLFFGSDALLLDLFPFVANPADREPRIGALLDRSRPGLDWIAAQVGRDLDTAGVGVPWREDAQAHVRTTRGESMTELDADSFDPGVLLLRSGVPVSAAQQGVNALFGSLAWAFDDGELRAMLAGGLLLDAAAAKTLCERGFGRDIGLTFGGWLTRLDHNYAMEEVADGERGAPAGHRFNINKAPRLGVLRPRRNAVAWTAVVTPERKRVGAGMVACENRRGGRVVTLAVAAPGANMPCDYHRQALVQAAVDFLAGAAFASPLVTGGPYLLPMHFHDGGRERLVIFNGSPDAARPLARIPGAPAGRIAATLLAPLAEPQRARVASLRKGGCTHVTSQVDVPYLGFLVLEWRAAP